MEHLLYPTTAITAITNGVIEVKSYESNLTIVYNYIIRQIQLLKNAKLELTGNNVQNEKDKQKLNDDNEASLQKIKDLEDALKKASSTLENIAKESQ